MSNKKHQTETEKLVELTQTDQGRVGVMAVEECEDYRNKSCYLVTKKRGKLSQDDIINAMNSEELYGNYILVIKVNGEPRGADGGIEPKEDTAIIYPVDDKFKECPICGYNPWEIRCRHCGKDLRKNIS